MNPPLETARISDASERYPIRTVSTLTGVNPVTLRAWERRYGLIKPKRTAKGHRLYTREDIELINQVVTLLDRGLSISQVRTALRSRKQPEGLAPKDAEPWRRYRERIIAAVTRFDEDAIEETYNNALSLYPVDIVTRRLLLPLLKELGDRWESAEGSVAEEHFLGVYLRNKLGARFHHRSRNTSGPKLLLACMAGEQHEIGLLLFALSAHDRGYRLVLLGPNMPLAELSLAAKRSASDAIALSGSIEPAPEVLNELAALVEVTGLPVFVGGATSIRHRDALINAGAIPLGQDIQQGLRRLGESIKESKHD